MTDPLFPFPAPTWLFVYDFLIYKTSTSASVIDDNGRWQYQIPEAVEVKGYIASPSPREIERAAARDIQIDSVALVPLGTDVTEADQFVSSSIGNIQDGTYYITEVRPNASHIRLILTRVPAPSAWPEEL